MYEYKVCSIDKVVDGDTVDLTVDLGFKIHHKLRVRLYGIDTPEARTRDLEEKKRGLAAKKRLKELLGVGGMFVGIPRDLGGAYFVLRTDKKGKYGRYLGTIIKRETVVEENEEVETNINDRLVEEGHAVRYYGGTR
ncbi:MAG TPA: thermonuclease family protein [Flavobacteriales bacterium]|nr:thermonuclease family protein [Flavobacteriales bacterium]